MKSMKVSRMYGAGQVRKKIARPLEDADQIEGIRIRIIGVDLRAEFPNAVLNLSFRDQRAERHERPVYDAPFETSSTSRTLRPSDSAVNGFCRNCVSLLRTPWLAIRSCV